MKSSHTLRSLLGSAWFMAAFLTGVFFITNGYHFGWDDQHLEIPLLKHLINPSLYAGDYYVESLQKNFSTFFYPALARLITVEQIPAAYFILFVISRYFFFFWTYKLWLFISKSRFKAVSCVLTFILVLRVSEFLYRTFSHQEFALAVIMAGIYYFYKDRFLLAALLLGIAANIHGLYSFFPMTYVGVYLIWQVKRHGWKTLVASAGVFLAAASPFILWVVKNRMGASMLSPDEMKGEWLSLFITACPQNFFFPQAPQIPFKALLENPAIFYALSLPYLVLLALFVFNLAGNRLFRNDKKALAVCLTALAFLGLCLVFTYFYPKRLFIDLNLVRNSQFLMFMLSGYTVIRMVTFMETAAPVYGLSFGALFTLLKYDNTAKIYALAIALLLIAVEKVIKEPRRLLKTFFLTVCAVLILGCVYGIVWTMHAIEYSFALRLNLVVIFALLTGNYLAAKIWRDERYRQALKKGFMIIPLLVFFGQFTVYSYQKHRAIEQSGGFWRLQRNWEDMQRFVKANTPQDAMILVPYDMEMGGFRIFSERKIVCSYRDVGIIGFDYAAALEWRRRVKDIIDYKVMMRASPLPAIKNAITKYDADYIVFMRYASPTRDNALLQRVYTNQDFALFRVLSPRRQ